MLDEGTIENIESLIKKGRKVTKNDLMAIPAIAQNPISTTLIDLYALTNETTNTKSINFRALITDLNNFISGKILDDKLKFLFKLYDADKDNKINNYELYCILEKMCDNSIDGKKIQNITDQTFRETNSTMITYDEFQHLIKKRTKNLNTFFFVGSKKHRK